MIAEPPSDVGAGDETSSAAHVDVTSVTDATGATDDAGVSPAARPLVGLVRVYQHLSAGRPSPCRHVPSCSTYAVEALQLHGAVRGSWLAAKRLGRCHPWGTDGYDPVPDRKAS